MEIAEESSISFANLRTKRKRLKFTIRFYLRDNAYIAKSDEAYFFMVTRTEVWYIFLWGQREWKPLFHSILQIVWGFQRNRVSNAFIKKTAKSLQIRKVIEIRCIP